MSHVSIPNGQVWKTYYYAGSQRVAMRVQDGVTDEVYYLFSDHLGSTSITTDSEGDLYAELHYTAWGEVRYASGEMLTDYTYTGQRSELSDFGLMYYNARWYEPYLNRWIQPDSIIPDPNNLLDYDRYAYARNNPVFHKDPDGHCPIPFFTFVCIGGVILLGTIGYDIITSPAYTPRSAPEPTSPDVSGWLADRINENSQSNLTQSIREDLTSGNVRKLLDVTKTWVSIEFIAYFNGFEITS